MAAKPPDAFLSYTRFDDEYHGGAISAFREQLSMAVRAVTARPFEIFQDVDGIGLGEKWRKRLNIALGEVRFFIPILTPSYFESRACRDELQTVLEFEAEGGRDDLILPIYWLRCRVLEEANLRARDPLAESLNDRQRSNWLKLRHKPFNDPDVREALEALAEQIEQARSRMLRADATRRPGATTPTANRITVSRPDSLPERQQTEESPKAASVSLIPGTIFRDIEESWCPEMVVIPPGEFMMGSTEAERQWVVGQGVRRELVEPEKRQHRVRIGYSLAVGRYPVTFEEYGHFASTTERAPPGDGGWDRGRRPVINVSWNDAKAYVAWLAAQTGQRYRLLSEAEWEYACRAGTTTRFWWGDEITPANANYGRNVGKTSEVGGYPANPFGLYDVHGNVWEWVEDRWHESYDGAPDDGSAWIAGDNFYRVPRGGSWDSVPEILRSAIRGRYFFDIRYAFIGFRVARRLSQSESVTPFVQIGPKVEREVAPLSFSEFARRLLIALSKTPGKNLNLKEVAELRNLRYENGWIARASEYLDTKGLISAKSRRHLQSGPDDDYYGIITGMGLAEAEKLQTDIT
jgi:formylglycine-generating enzyme required for sulfatase activity